MLSTDCTSTKGPLIATISSPGNVIGLSRQTLPRRTVLDLWLAWSTGLPVLAFQHVYLTRLPDENLSHTGLPRSCLATLSLDTVEDVMGGEVDELEEDVGISISCLEGVNDVEE